MLAQRALEESRQHGEQLERAVTHLRKKSDQEIADLIEPEPPIEPLIIVEEPTYEGLVKYLARGQPSVGLFSDEGGRFVGGNAMNRDNLLKTLAGLSSLWDAKPINHYALKVHRFKEEAKKTTESHFFSSKRNQTGGCEKMDLSIFSHPPV